MLAGEEYGVDILRVQEIKGWDTVTSIPNTPVYIKGVINLRGTIVPLIDLRERFGLEHLAYGETTVVIVLKVVRDHRERIMGLVVDAVSDVYNVSREQMKPRTGFRRSRSEPSWSKDWQRWMRRSLSCWISTSSSTPGSCL